VKRAGGGLTLTFAEIKSPEEAEKLRGVDLVVPEVDLPPAPPGVYYHYQIIGALVVTPQGKTLGRVSEILETPAHDLYVVRPESGGAELLLPAVAGVIREVDTLAGVIKADPPVGTN
jgi:16S rRNA processing protein RimM